MKVIKNDIHESKEVNSKMFDLRDDALRMKTVLYGDGGSGGIIKKLDELDKRFEDHKAKVNMRIYTWSGAAAVLTFVAGRLI